MRADGEAERVRFREPDTLSGPRCDLLSAEKSLADARGRIV
jgi:hypothetical protein